MLTPHLMLALCCCGFTGAAAGEIAHDKGRHIVRLIGFSREGPCTLDRLSAADREAGWGVMSHDPASDTHVLNASLHVGSSDGSETFLRIGSKGHPKVRLVIKGDLVVREPKKQGYQIYQAHNGLAIGSPNDTSIAATVLFDCTSPGEFGLNVEGGNFLDIHNATVSALKKERSSRFELLVDVRARSGGVHVTNSTLSWFTTVMLPSADGQVRGVTFEDGGELRGITYLEDCTIRRLDAGVRDHGSLLATLVRCCFESNTYNWQLLYTHWGIMTIDCVFSEPKRPSPIRAYTWPKTGRVSRPSFIAKRHLVVSVKDEAGRPIPNASVRLSCEQGDLSAVQHGQARTDREGMTPAPASGQALFVTDYAIRSGEDTRHYTYTLSASAAGHDTAVVASIDPSPASEATAITLRTGRRGDSQR